MKFIGFIVVALVVLLNVSTDEAMQAQIEYCNLVELYESQDGIEPHLRDGHPNYNLDKRDRLYEMQEGLYPFNKKSNLKNSFLNGKLI